MPSEPVMVKQFRIPAKLGQNLEAEAKEKGVSQNAIIVELLEERYGEVEK